MTTRPTLKDIQSWPALQVEPRTPAGDPLSMEMFLESVGLVTEGIRRLILGGHLDLDEAMAVFNSLRAQLAQGSSDHA
ncbi:MAG TPA: hypothetical protein VKV73_14250 [Chloroflexota bacterium]|nr:hypothetical protein [Chloroflexota bacterium]